MGVVLWGSECMRGRAQRPRSRHIIISEFQGGCGTHGNTYDTGDSLAHLLAYMRRRRCSLPRAKTCRCRIWNSPQFTFPPSVVEAGSRALLTAAFQAGGIACTTPPPVSSTRSLLLRTHENGQRHRVRGTAQSEGTANKKQYSTSATSGTCNWPTLSVLMQPELRENKSNALLH